MVTALLLAAAVALTVVIVAALSASRLASRSLRPAAARQGLLRQMSRDARLESLRRGGLWEWPGPSPNAAQSGAPFAPQSVADPAPRPAPRFAPRRAPPPAPRPAPLPAPPPAARPAAPTEIPGPAGGIGAAIQGLPLALLGALAPEGFVVLLAEGVVFDDSSASLAERIRERQAVARQAPTRAAAADAYVKQASVQTSDPENVHDTGAIACQAAIVNRLRQDQAGQPLAAVDQIRAWLSSEGAALSGGRPELARAALEAADCASQETPVLALAATDTECLRRVWLRIDDPRNAAHRRELRQALFDALAGAWESGPRGWAVVCPNGRAGRILGALALLDWDERNWAIARFETLKLEIFARARAVIDAEAGRAATDARPAMRAAASALLVRDPVEFQALGPAPEAESAELTARICAAIDADIDAFAEELRARSGIVLPKHALESVKAEARAALV